MTVTAMEPLIVAAGASSGVGRAGARHVKAVASARNTAETAT
jgi:hypothetical protein